jgi:predicted MFS family arabinose efflux permease
MELLPSVRGLQPGTADQDGRGGPVLLFCGELIERATVGGWLFEAAPRQLEAVQAVFVSLSQVAIGAGALAGGLLVDRVGVTGALSLAVVATSAAACLMAAGARSRRPTGGIVDQRL